MIARHRFAFVALLGACALVPGHLVAQQGTQLSFDATVGTSWGRGGGERGNRNGPALDALLTWRARSPALFHGAFAISTGVQGHHGSDTPCLPLPGSGCLPDFPRIYTLGVLFGLEHQGKLGAARLLAGPTHFRVDGGGSALGAQARFELVSPAFHRIALVGSARGGAVWRLDRQDFRLGAIGIGLGIY